MQNGSGVASIRYTSARVHDLALCTRNKALTLLVSLGRPELTTVIVIPATTIHPQIAVGAPPLLYAMGREPAQPQIAFSMVPHSSPSDAELGAQAAWFHRRCALLLRKDAAHKEGYQHVLTCDAQQGADDGEADRCV